MVEMNLMYLRVKRVLDLAGAAMGLILTAPLMILIASAVRMKMGSPVLFRQTRPGLGERPFVCLKFRTMTDERDDDGNLLPESRRMTALGLFLRRTSLDELPQFWNILRGDLSFIGPRPLLERYSPYYTDDERRRHAVRPGLTGLAQVTGRGTLSWDERLRLDAWYADHLSFLLDLRLFLATIWVVLAQKGRAEGSFHALDEERSAMRDANPRARA